MDCDTFQHQALQVCMPDESYDPSIEPQDGHEYLTKVVYERQNTPAIVVVGVPDSLKNNNGPKEYLETCFGTEATDIIDTSPNCLRPSMQWKRTQLRDFAGLRQKIQNLRIKLAENGFSCDENDSMPLSNECCDWKIFCQNNQPLLSIILRIDQESLIRLLKFEIYWLTDEYNDDQQVDLTKNEIWLGSWIYSTLVCLHLPLVPDAHSLLRRIAKACITLRNQLNPDDVQRVIPLNLFILIISKSFDQFDFLKYV